MIRLRRSRLQFLTTLLTGWCISGVQLCAEQGHFEFHQVLNDPTVSGGDEFGGGLLIDDRHILVSAIWDTTSPDTRGQVHVFDAHSATLLHTLVDPTPATRGFFGDRFALGGNTVLVTERFGEIHQFDLRTGAFVRTYTGSGFDSVALEGNLVLIGSPQHYDPVGGPNVGEARLFDANSGVLLRTIANPINQAGDGFGYRVAIDDGRALISAPFDFTPLRQGKAHLFDATSGSLLSSFVDPSIEGISDFGLYAIGLDGNYVAVSSPLDNKGEIHFFDSSTGALEYTLLPPEHANGFGTSFQIDNNRILAGTRSMIGEALLYDLNSLTLTQQFTGNSSANNDRFGWSVALASDRLVIGASRDDTQGIDVGQAYLYVMVPEPTHKLLLLWVVVGLGLYKRNSFQ